MAVCGRFSGVRRCGGGFVLVCSNGTGLSVRSGCRAVEAEPMRLITSSLGMRAALGLTKRIVGLHAADAIGLGRTSGGVGRRHQVGIGSGDD
jgi:hypothetical protein